MRGREWTFKEKKKKLYSVSLISFTFQIFHRVLTIILERKKIQPSGLKLA